MEDIKKHQSHNECTLSDTDVFTPVFIQTDIKHGFFNDVFPISKLDDNGPVEFVLENSSEHFLDLANTYFKFKIQIKKEDGSDIADTDKVAPVNYIFGALSSQVDVSLGGTVISSSNNNYPYRAYEEVLINYARDSKKSQLSLGLYMKDQHGKLAEVDPAKNTALKERVDMFKTGNVVEVYGKLHSDIFNQARLMLNGLSLKVSLQRTKPEFMLLSSNENANYKIVINEAVMCVRKVQLTPHKFEQIQKRLEITQANYPIDRVDIRTRSVAAGLSSLSWHNTYQGQIPNKVVIGIVNNSAYVGNFAENPFNFAHHSVRKVGVYVDGESLPGKPMTLNFDKGLYLEGYKSLFDVAGTFGTDDGTDITRKDYKNGYSLFGFDISQSYCRGGHQEPKIRGSLSIELEFQKALSKTITVIVYSQFENTVSIDKFRNVIKDY